MNSILCFFCRKSFLSVAMASALILAIPAGQAQTAPELSKHARKMEKRLSRYGSGTYLDLAFRDSSQAYGSLGQLSAVSFQFTDSDSNRLETRSYDDVTNVKKAKEYIGSGSEPGRHFHLSMPILIGAGAAAAAFAIVEVVR